MNCFADRAKLPAEATSHGLVHLVCATLSQHRAPLTIRALAADSSIDWPDLFSRHVSSTTGAFVLSTCNRFEIYLYDSLMKPARLAHALNQILANAFAGLEGGALSAGNVSVGEIGPDASAVAQPGIVGYFDLFQGEDAARHLCRVGAGIESKVFGESEILGQLTRAYEAHVARHALNRELDAIVRTAVRTGKRVRHETRIGANAGNIGSLALQTVESSFGTCAGATVAVIGVGEMGRLVARGAIARGAGHILLVNRTQDRAHSLARELNAEVVGWDDLEIAVQRADIVFCATASPAPVLTEARVSRCLASHSSGEARVETTAPETGLTSTQHKILVDLAVPRDIALDVAQLEGVHVLDLDGLQADLDQSLAERHAALPEAQQIIAHELEQLSQQLRELACRPLIVDLRQHAEQIRRQELERTLKHIGEVDPATAQHIEHLTRALVNKLYHDPTVWIRELAGRDPGEVPTELLRALFGLPQAADSGASSALAEDSSLPIAEHVADSDPSQYSPQSAQPERASTSRNENVAYPLHISA